MNFYFNYFTSIGREQSICHLSSVITFSCLFLKKLTFRRNLFTFHLFLFTSY